ncbi:MAG TPA: acyl-CoA thioesterase/BAAT N-terminal domain-containing protein, partial [Candidatus Binataceae bacterium]|nr:acyl-CoA thioesterase/BAAT N-terminal domain-containing protein [Candidatus Binataceae bacterium]
MRIEADRTDTLYDQSITIRILDCAPGAAVTVRASTSDDAQHRWESHALLIANSGGTIDLARDVAASGTYPGKDAMGLFWSMRLDPAVVERHPFIKTSPTPVLVTITAEQAGATASLEVTRRLMGAGVRRTEIRDNGIVATFFDHENGARPGVIVVAGSG